MATVKKSKTKKFVVPICILLIVAIIIGSAVIVKNNKSVEAVTLATIATDGITENVSATGEVTSGTVREYKAASTATCKEVFVKVGDKVKKGDVLATFDTEALNSQISSLQATYDSSAKSYKEAVASQKVANAKLASINKQIPLLENQLANAKKEAQTLSTVNAKLNNSSKNTASVAALYDDGPTTPTTPSYDSSLAGLVEALGALVETIGGLTDDIEETNALTKLVMQAIMEQIEKGVFDSDKIADAVGEAVSDAIEQGVIDFVDSGAAVELIEASVSSIDWAGIGNGFAETYSVQTATIEMQLAALYAEKELFTVQADPSVANAQKQVRDSSKQALDALREAQNELSTGWKASMNGVITECNLVAGAQTTLLETGIKLENQSKMVVNISLGEYDVHKVKVGMPATIKTAYGEYTGEIATIAPTASGASQGSILDSVGSMAGISGLSSLTSSGAGVKCTVTVNDPDENIIAGFDASVDILVGEYKGIPVVPIESMVLEKDGTYVYLYDEEEGTVTKTKIETGAISDSAYEVKSGLAVGDQIIATPTAYKEDTFKVKVATKK